MLDADVHVFVCFVLIVLPKFPGLLFPYVLLEATYQHVRMESPPTQRRTLSNPRVFVLIQIPITMFLVSTKMPK